jgi:uncharacterized membrane protein YoaK (UPF0700 family)
LEDYKSMTTRLKNLREGFLMTLTVASGAADAICFLAFGKVFSAFMTGNLVFLGIGAAGAFKAGGPNLPRVAVGLGAFSLGVFIATRIIRHTRRSRIAAHGVSWSLSAILITQAAFAVCWIVASGHPSLTFATVLVGVEAVAMGMQSGVITSLGLKAVVTTAATATLINLAREAADPRVSETSPARLVRILVSLIAGAAVGGALLVSARTYAALVPGVATAIAIGIHETARRLARDTAPSAGAVLAIDRDGTETLARTDPALGWDDAA